MMEETGGGGRLTLTGSPHKKTSESCELQLWSSFMAAMKDFLITCYFLDYFSIYDVRKYFFFNFHHNFQKLGERACFAQTQRNVTSDHINKNS